MTKLYFCKDVYYDNYTGEEFCCDLKSILKEAKKQELTEVEIIEAEANIGEGLFYCTHFQFVGETGEGCGKICEAYKPRNGKNGRCVHSGYCYSPTDKKRTIKINQNLKP